VTVIQLTAFGSLCSCNNNISLKMAAKAAETCWWEFSAWTLKCFMLAIHIIVLIGSLLINQTP